MDNVRVPCVKRMGSSPAGALRGCVAPWWHALTRRALRLARQHSAGGRVACHVREREEEEEEEEDEEEQGQSRTFTDG